MLQSLKRWFKGLLLAAAVSAVFYFLGAFSLVQSILPALALLFIHENLRPRSPARITRFSVLIRPEWQLLLKDHRLVDDMKWGEIQRYPSYANGILERGFFLHNPRKKSCL